MNCRHCGSELNLVMADLGTAPPSNAFLTEKDLERHEVWFPLRVLVCESCWLVQTQDFSEAADLFTADYVYLSAYSKSWLAHAERYVDMVVNRFALDSQSFVLEVAANDGYLLQYVAARGLRHLGVEPTHLAAEAARNRGVNIEEAFFGEKTAQTLVSQYGRADLCVANNVLAHVPDINDFVAGFRIMLSQNGVATFEFPHLKRLVEGFLFDTIYHEHYSYLSLMAVSTIFARAGLRVFDVEHLTTHGGSYRVFACLHEATHQTSVRVQNALAAERESRLDDTRTFTDFQSKLTRFRRRFVEEMLRRTQSRKLCAYGAAAKGNTLLNFCGIDHHYISGVIDQNPEKQGKYTPGSRIPVIAEPDHLTEPVLLLPWNLESEIRADFKRNGHTAELFTYRSLIE